MLTRRVLRFLANRQAMVSARLAAGILSRPLLQVQRRSSQEIAYALTTGVAIATTVVLGQTVIAVTEMAVLVVLTAGLFAISPIVTLFAILFFAVIGAVLQRTMSSWAGRIGRKAANVEVASYASIQEALRTYREAVVSHRRGVYVKSFQALRWDAAVIQSDLQFMGLLPKYLFEVALIVGAALLAGSQFLTRDLNAAVAVIAIFLAAGSRVVPSMLRLQGAAVTVRTAAGQAAPTFALANEVAVDSAGTDVTKDLGSTDPLEIRHTLEHGHPDFTPAIAVSGVWLRYPDSSAPALTDVSIDLPAGSSLALVGPTGAGKSTLADVILGVLFPTEGSVTIGGLTPAAAVARWPGAIAYVPQEVAMTSGTVRDNVALGLPREAIDDDWVWDALERAHLAEFLRENREGLDTVIGEGGMKLSGGQRQRLGVARALYTKPRLLVLDEATSALDAETEQAIASTLQQLEGSVTTVTVAHRLATIRHCDLVVYMEDGRAAAQGTFDEVRRMAPNFDQQAQLLGL
jgi:ABC-type multidrug transport system fused ATPase/permease subunit